MFSQRKFWSTLALLSLVVVSAAKADPAPEPKGVTADDTKWLLPDAEFFVKFNVKQMMSSDLMTKGGIAAIQQAIKNNEQLKGVLEATDLDITKDLDSIMASGSGNSAKDAKALVVIRGKFNRAKMEGTLEKASKKDDKLKIVKEGGLTLYEFPAGDNTMYAAFADRNTMVMTHSKDATVTALKEGGKKSATLSAGMKSALGRFTGKESMTMALVINADLQKMLAGIPNVGAAASKLSTVTTAVTLTDAVALDVAGVTGDPKSAKQLSAILDALKATGAAALAGMEEIPPVAGELLNAVKVSATKEAVHIKLDVTKEMLDKASKGGAK
jgi:hypothetical protein